MPVNVTKRLPADSSLFFKLVRVVNLTARPFQEGVGKAHQLSLNEWRAMVVLASHPGTVAREVADSTGLDKMAVSRALSGLEKHGRLERRAHASDARSSKLYLTAEGKRVFRALGALASQREADLFGSVSASEVAQMSATLDKLIAALRSVEPD